VPLGQDDAVRREVVARRLESEPVPLLAQRDVDEPVRVPPGDLGRLPAWGRGGGTGTSRIANRIKVWEDGEVRAEDDGMADKAPNEKLIETLFTYYALRHLDGECVAVYTPSTREEFLKGYDAKLMGASSFDELYIQFKTPLCLAKERWRYSIHTTPHQHCRLQTYPFNTAFYVTHTFRTVSQIQKAQGEAAKPADFLQYYVAIEIRRLEDDVKFFRYTADQSFMPYEVVYNRHADRAHPRTPTHVCDMDSNDWMTGEELLRRFKAGSLGAWMLLEGDPAKGLLQNIDGEELVVRPQHRRPEQWVVPRAQLAKLCPPDEKEEWGTSLRKNIEPRPAATGE
jgi:hypothetical protein